MKIKPEKIGVSIVLIGHFNPAIFSPAWFGSNGVVSGEQASTAEIKVIHPQLSQFRMESFDLTIQQDRFSIEASREPWVLVLDFVQKTFMELLPHTPINQMGINVTSVFSLGFDAKSRLGAALAPREPWGRWGRKLLEPEGMKGLSGLTSIVMQQGHGLTDRPGGHVSAKIESKGAMTNAAVNDHYQFSQSEGLGAREMMSLLAENFEASLARSNEIIDDVMSLAYS